MDAKIEAFEAEELIFEKYFKEKIKRCFH